MTTGEIIKTNRLRLGLTQRELGEMLGVNKAAVQKWEAGTVSNLKKEVLQKLAEIFSVSIDSMLEVQSNQWEEKYNSNGKLAEEVIRAEEFTSRDKRDVAISMNFLMEQLDNYQEALMFDGQPLDENDRELLKTSLENSLKIGKTIAKRKYSKKKS